VQDIWAVMKVEMSALVLDDPNDTTTAAATTPGQSGSNSSASQSNSPTLDKIAKAKALELQSQLETLQKLHSALVTADGDKAKKMEKLARELSHASLALHDVRAESSDEDSANASAIATSSIDTTEQQSQAQVQQQEYLTALSTAWDEMGVPDSDRYETVTYVNRAKALAKVGSALNDWHYRV
jgi:hypothetical protein